MQIPKAANPALVQLPGAMLEIEVAEFSIALDSLVRNSQSMGFVSIGQIRL